jgi:3-methyladenine DNA glycosylase/8-oxoguanine DNA glycosylase
MIFYGSKSATARDVSEAANGAMISPRVRRRIRERQESWASLLSWVIFHYLRAVR